MASCKQCQAQFETSEMERKFLDGIALKFDEKKFEIPNPKLCPFCRRQRRYMFRNDIKLFKRNCDKTGKGILSVYPDGVPFPVYSGEAWWADDWDPRDYGRDFDFNRPFFEQYRDLVKEVPHIFSMVVQSENCDYATYALQCRNCYLLFRAAESEDVYYTYLALKSNTSFDCYNIEKCELCYECTDCLSCYDCKFVERSRNSNNLWFCSDMLGCKNCFGCIGLVQKEHHFFNRPLSKEEYAAKVQDYLSRGEEGLKEAAAQFELHRKNYPVRATNVLNSENALGSSIFESRNIWQSFDMNSCEDALYCTQSEHCKDIMDTDFGFQGERLYEHLSAGSANKCAFNFVVMGGGSDLYYCMESYNGTQNCFGCIGMRKGQYCILNKQYPKEEYEKLVARIIEHMQKTGEWGEYFPHSLSPFAYNDTVAFRDQPLSKEEVLAKGWCWREEIKLTDRPFKLVPKEINYCERNGLPNPKKHPDLRLEERMGRRNSYRLRQTQCRKCGQEISTDYSDDSLQIFCLACYTAHTY